MKGIRFYEEFASSRKMESEGNCIALFTSPKARIPGKPGERECVAALYFRPNSPVCIASCSRRHLRERCKRVSEERAREVHPRLFERLDRAEEDFFVELCAEDAFVWSDEYPKAVGWEK